VSVENDRLSEALRRLPEQKRTIILLYYFLGMNDGEISQRLHLPQKNITKTRQRTLNSLKKNMEDSNDEI
ncbi:MAG: sigma-70 family RNA polymerase sigma factor, partial [Clostridia bacterium]